MQNQAVSSFFQKAQDIINNHFIIICTGFFALGAWILFDANQLFFDHNDFMYASDAARSGLLYEDIHYVQAPLSHYFWRFVYVLSPEGFHYSSMRFISACLALSSIFPILIWVLKTPLQRLTFLALGLSNFYILRSGLEIGNYSLSLFLMSCAMALYLSRNHKNVIISGLFFGLAVSVKLNFAILIFPALAFILLGSLSDTTKKIKTAFFFCIVFGIGVLPVIFYLLYNPHSFILHNLTFHTGITNVFRGVTLPVTLERFKTGFLTFLYHNIVETLFLLWFFSFSLLKGIESKEENARENFLVVFSFLGAAVIMAMTPMTMYDQYLVPSAFALLVLIMCACHCLDTKLRDQAMVFLLFISCFKLFNLFVEYNSLRSSYASTLRQHYIIRNNINAQVVKDGNVTDDCENSVFTLSGSLIVDTKLPLSHYTETGVFWSLVYDHVPDKYKNSSKYNFDRNLIYPENYILQNDVAYVLIGYYPSNRFEKHFDKNHALYGYESIEVGSLYGHDMKLYRKNKCFHQG